MQEHNLWTTIFHKLTNFLSHAERCVAVLVEKLANPEVPRGDKLPHLVRAQTSDIDAAGNVDALSHVRNILQKKCGSEKREQI